MTQVDPSTGHGVEPSGTVAVVIGSTRPTRICPGIARWVRQVLQEDSPLRYELIDLAEIGLPFLDEPLMAALQRYQHDHTRRWSRMVSSCDGFVFVFPQYNWGYPGVLKNALDFLYHEWHDKPVSLVTYGTRGGSKGAEQLRGVLAGLHMHTLDHHLEVVITDDDVDDQWQLRDLAAIMHPYRAEIRAIDSSMVGALRVTQ